MNGSGAPKENANPIIFQVNENKTKRQHGQQQKPIGWDDAIHAFNINCYSKNDESGDTKKSGDIIVGRMYSIEEYAVLRTLQETAIDTNDKSISLLKRIGVWDTDDNDYSVDESNHHSTAGSTRRKILEPPPSLDNIVLFASEQQQRRVNNTTSRPTTSSSNTSTSINNSTIKEEEVDAEENEDKKRIERDPITADEIFDIIRNIQDPEHPLTLEQLGVVSRHQIIVQDDNNTTNDLSYSTITIRFTPTIPHCSMATLIGLCIRVKLIRSLPSRFKVTLQIEPGTHQTEDAINKQLADKERVCAALDNKHLLGVVNKCIAQGMVSN